MSHPPKRRFQIADEPESKRPELVWGEPVNGLRAAVEFRSRDNTAQSRLDDSRGEFPHGSRLSVYLHVRNVSEQAISFWSETWRQDDAVMLVDENGKETRLEHPWYSGWADRRTLDARSRVRPRFFRGNCRRHRRGRRGRQEVGASRLAPSSSASRASTGYGTNCGSTLGKRKDNDGRVIPGDGDWQGTLSTGITTIGGARAAT